MKQTQKKPRQLTIKQRKFVDEVIKTGNATESAMKVYNCKSRSVAKSVGPENLAKPCIKAEIDKRLNDAKQKIYHLSQSAGKEEVQLRASQDIIDRREGKAVGKLELTGKDGEGIKFEVVSNDQARKIAERIISGKGVEKE